jgi:hypothetical protein
LSAPAKKQKDQIDPKSFHTEGQNEYNIWYDRYVGDTKDKSSLREPAEDRCKLDRDAGYTKADKGNAADTSSISAAFNTLLDDIDLCCVLLI